MKLSDLNKLFFFLVIFLNTSFINAEEEIDIWKKNNSNENNEEIKSTEKKSRVH